MELDARIRSLLEKNAKQRFPNLFSSSYRTASYRIWESIAEHLTMLKLLKIEATDKELLDWAIQLAQATAIEGTDLSVDVDFEDLRRELEDISSKLSSIRETLEAQ